MSVTRMMSTMADAAAQRYGMLLDGLQALYNGALDDPRFGTPAAIDALVVNAYKMARLYLAAEQAEIEDAFDTIVAEALKATRQELDVADSEQMSDELSEHVSAFQTHLYSEIAIQIERDIAQLKTTLRQTVLAVTLASRAQRLPLKTALIQHRIGVNTTVRFAFQDRKAARWPARRYIRTIWRHDLLALYNDTVMMELAEHGIDTAHVRHTDPTSAIHGTEVSLIATTELPTYADIRDEAFHPNADAVIARHA